MKAIDRLFLTILCLLVIGLCVLLGYTCFSPQMAEYISNFLYNSSYAWQITVVVLVGCALVTLLALKVMFFRRPGEKLTGGVREPKQVNIGNGDISIAVDAINDIVAGKTRTQDGVSDATSHVEAQENGIAIVLNITTSGTVSIPLMAEAVQEAVQETLQTICGITPTQVRVMVDTGRTQGGAGSNEIARVVR